MTVKNIFIRNHHVLNTAKTRYYVDDIYTRKYNDSIPYTHIYICMRHYILVTVTVPCQTISIFIAIAIIREFCYLCPATRHIFFNIRKNCAGKLPFHVRHLILFWRRHSTSFASVAIARMVNVALRGGRYNFYNIFTNSHSTLYDMSRA